MKDSTPLAVRTLMSLGGRLRRSRQNDPIVQGPEAALDYARRNKEQLSDAMKPVRTRWGPMALVRAEDGLCTLEPIVPEPSVPDRFVAPCHELWHNAPNAGVEWE